MGFEHAPLVPLALRPMRAGGPPPIVKAEVGSVINQEKGPPIRARPRILPQAAALSFTLGLIALRVCWLPGVNCLLALGAVTTGIIAVWRIMRARGMSANLDEAVSGIVLGLIVLGLSAFFVSALIAAYR